MQHREQSKSFAPGAIVSTGRGSSQDIAVEVDDALSRNLQKRFSAVAMFLALGLGVTASLVQEYIPPFHGLVFALVLMAAFVTITRQLIRGLVQPETRRERDRMARRKWREDTLAALVVLSFAWGCAHMALLPHLAAELQQLVVLVTCLSAFAAAIAASAYLRSALSVLVPLLTMIAVGQIAGSLEIGYRFFAIILCFGGLSLVCATLVNHFLKVRLVYS